MVAVAAGEQEIAGRWPGADGRDRGGQRAGLHGALGRRRAGGSWPAAGRLRDQAARRSSCRSRTRSTRRGWSRCSPSSARAGRRAVAVADRSRWSPTSPARPRAADLPTPVLDRATSAAGPVRRTGSPPPGPGRHAVPGAGPGRGADRPGTGRLPNRPRGGRRRVLRGGQRWRSRPAGGAGQAVRAGVERRLGRVLPPATAHRTCRRTPFDHQRYWLPPGGAR